MASLQYYLCYFHTLSLSQIVVYLQYVASKMNFPVLSFALFYGKIIPWYSRFDCIYNFSVTQLCKVRHPEKSWAMLYCFSVAHLSFLSSLKKTSPCHTLCALFVCHACFLIHCLLLFLFPFFAHGVPFLFSPSSSPLPFNFSHASCSPSVPLILLSSCPLAFLSSLHVCRPVSLLALPFQVHLPFPVTLMPSVCCISSFVHFYPSFLLFLYLSCQR